MEVTSAAFAILLLTAAFCSPTCTAAFIGDTPTACCFSYTSQQISQDTVGDYYYTNSQCSKPAVIFQTKKGKQICANPSDAWVQKYVSYLELNA
ncbi:C-C motif chemokine 3-like 1 [Rhynchocyon petersi]